MDIEDPGHREAAMMLAKELDVYLGLPSLFWDREDKRRSMYGKAGAYRVKHYGMEYRSLSNAWVKDEDLIRLVFRNTKRAVTQLLEGKSAAEQYSRHIRNAINDNNRDLAQAIIQALSANYEEVEIPE